MKNTQKITRAMKLVSGAKLRRAQERILAARPYAQKMTELLRGLAKSANPELHPLLACREPKKAEVVVITADRGLCGSFNANAIRRALETIKQRQGEGMQVSLTPVGKKARDFFKKRSYPIRKNWTNFFDRLNFGHASEIARDIEKAFLEKAFDVCDLIYNEFRSAASQRVVVERLLPVGAINAADESGGGPPPAHLYEPLEEEIFERLLPRYIEVQVFRALLESSASEQGARMMAMDAATRNAQEMIYKLTQVYNKTRQAVITKELMDIIGGAEALK